MYRESDLQIIPAVRKCCV